MASPDTKSTMVSDGKRMRPVWKPGNGNGDSAAYTIQRSLLTIKGHPTWKIYIDDIVLPIVRDSADEPPRYVYLDDRACYTIWCTGTYTNAEMGEFWPFDFNTLGHVKTGRKNRGRPAWTDETETTYAKLAMRGRNKVFEFCGDPEETEYVPVRPKAKTKMEELVAQEIAEEEQATLSTEEITSSSVAKSVKVPMSAPNRPLPASSLELGIKPMPLPSRSVEGPSHPDVPNSWKHKRKQLEISLASDPREKAKRVKKGKVAKDLPAKDDSAE
ncbi:hypothetical protein P280DRAFT_548281 [Massarina eburnea CBS 473.64]|uniref:Uncharacterized protein n=1 Tax=Massarina eburnea CBS 473.64 TaxID=1395130 RepID=A0A6A6S799_9PLEO|nr:hypothetical protein P280DRAFT_548281 [Massarina eburnea CBS 473.64]